jgi:6-phosphogluconolactonase
MKLKSILALITGVAIASTALGQSTEASSQSNPQQTDVSTRRAVYTQTNAADGNEVLVFRHDSRGVLDLVTKVKTRGLGTGVTLGSQGALALTRDGRHLYVVNAGSDSISAFAVWIVAWS